MLRSIWAYRGFIYASVAREFHLRISGSILGAWWVVLAPLAQAVMYALVLSGAMQARLPGSTDQFAYAIYLLAGLAGWTLFSEILTRGVSIFLENANLLKKLALPRIILPISVAISAGINHIIFLIITLAVMWLTGHSSGLELFALIPLGLLTIGFASALGILLGIFNVFYRDVGHLVSIVMQFLFWATPIVYVKDILSPRMQSFLSWNPLCVLIDGYHQAIYLHQIPDCLPLLKFGGGVVALAAIAVWVFRQAQSELVDAL